MSLSKKHFIELADIFAATEPPTRLKADREKHELWQEIRGQVMNFCQGPNFRFDRERFVEWSEREK